VRSALGQFDSDLFVASFFFVVTGQSGSQPACLYSNDGVRPRVERRFAIENFDANRVFLELFTAARHRLFNNVAEKSLEPVDLRKCRAGQQTGQMFANRVFRFEGFGCHAVEILADRMKPRSGVKMIAQG